MKRYYRVMLGKKSLHADECFSGGFIGTHFNLDQDLTHKLPDEWRQFNREFIPVYQQIHPGKSKISAGLACGAIWTVSKGIQSGDIVLCPDGNGNYRVGEVTGHYTYAPGQILPHRRMVQWLELSIARAAMSEALRNSTGSIGTVAEITDHAREIEQFLAEAKAASPIIVQDAAVEDPLAFAMEKHLEAFLVENWPQTELSREYLIYTEDGEPVGQQYATDAGAIDILAISRDGKKLLVVELKRGRASDVVVGQILRYIGFVKEQIAEPEQIVEGAIIALEDDPKMRWALAAVPFIQFYRYQLSFKLVRS
jgi:restriction system protein